MKRLIVLVFFSLFVVAGAHSQSVKIGVVDMQRALNESKEGMEAKKEISKKAETMQNELKQLQQELDKLKTENRKTKFLYE